MKVLTIGGKEYTFEFTIEAALYNDCTEKITSLLYKMEEAQDNENPADVLKNLCDVPQTTMSMFYAGLIEHHGASGDGSVLNEGDAKKLIRQYFAEHKEDGKGNFYAVMEIMIDTMSDDDFFKLVGLNQMLETEEKTEKSPKVPQDHKKKTTKATDK
jgi:CRISPR/Cas system CSM-associated protein Csm2 small subunit